MHWKVKAHLLAALSRLPYGRQLYHGLQRVAGTNRLQLDRDLGRAFELVRLAEESGTPITNAEILEVGTGWRPLVPYVFALAGAKQVRTFDVNPWLTHAYALETWGALESRLEEIAAEANVPLEDVLSRYRAVDPRVETLDELLQQIHVTYVYPGDARATELPESSIDMVISSNVLEHIPREIQLAIHQESFRILRTGGTAIHRFNPQDHYSTVDTQITNVNFLQFGTEEWKWLGGSGLAYHNRLRAPEYRELFELSGFDLEICRERVDPRSLQAITTGEITVHAEFSKFSSEELAVDYMWVSAKKTSPQHAGEERPTTDSVSFVVNREATQF